MTHSTIKKTNEKTTIYLDPKVKRSVQYYALRDSRSLSEIINERLFEYLEDMADAAALEESRQDGESFVPFAQVVEELGLSINEIHRKAQTERKEATKKT